MNIGLFLGSFNPIHIGHMAIANYMVEFGPIDQLWFVVTPHNPLKEKNNLIDNRARLEMVKLAIDGDNRFWASDVEFGLSQPSYTIHTLEHLKQTFPEHTFSLIMGADNYVTINKWRNWESIVQNYDILIYPRPSFDHKLANVGSRTHFIGAPLIEIASTFIRNAIANGNDVRHFLHPYVSQYIKSNCLYTKRKT